MDLSAVNPLIAAGALAVPIGAYALVQLARLAVPGPHRQARFNFKDKTVLITGASTGLGAALARELYTRGARLILVARSIDKLKALCESIKESGPGHEPVYAYLDLAEPEKVDELVKLSHNGKIDCLVNNAGISMRGSVIDTDMAVQRKVMETNYFGQVAVTRALLPFIPSDGAIVVTSSMQGKMALPYRSAYGASKHAVQAFFDSLRAEERFGLHILVVSAGYIATELGNNALDASGRPTGVTDGNVGNGLKPEEAARQIANATERRKPELLMAPLLHRFTVFLRYWWPSLYFYSVWKRHIMQEAKEKKKE
ncbi:dhs-30 [Pristionchus pacificus]|uniref:Ketoreductase domain-containing protein n=1 Tax=Pristionchus pacificus TaxID=54126 RepID=A0A8R1Z853_PRIPA|nr:dhs-30 [Pristionchus pacificus]